MKKKYIIDAYNLMHQMPEIKAMLSDQLETARENLLKALQTAKHRLDAEFTVVFDGVQSITRRDNAGYAMKVLYSSKQENADALIKRMIETAGKQNTIIVSSDREITDYARLYSIAFIPSHRFLHEMQTFSEKKFDKSEVKLNEKEVDEWMEIFNKAKDR